MIIKPTVGRVVWYFPSEGDFNDGFVIHESHSGPCTAHVVYVWSDTCVNLVVFDHEGVAFRRTSVAINMEGASPHAEWMPYQVGQAKKHEAEDKSS